MRRFKKKSDLGSYVRPTTYSDSNASWHHPVAVETNSFLFLTWFVRKNDQILIGNNKILIILQTWSSSSFSTCCFYYCTFSSLWFLFGETVFSYMNFNVNDDDDDLSWVQDWKISRRFKGQVHVFNMFINVINELTTCDLPCDSRVVYIYIYI